jgi:hypothetical protein
MRITAKKVLRALLLAIPVIMAVYYFFPEDKFPPAIIIDKIEVYKSNHEMRVYSKGLLIKTYTVAIGGDPVGQKEFEGDKKTPEYRVLYN